MNQIMSSIVNVAKISSILKSVSHKHKMSTRNQNKVCDTSECLQKIVAFLGSLEHYMRKKMTNNMTKISQIDKSRPIFLFFSPQIHQHISVSIQNKDCRILKPFFCKLQTIPTFNWEKLSVELKAKEKSLPIFSGGYLKKLHFAFVLFGQTSGGFSKSSSSKNWLLRYLQ